MRAWKDPRTLPYRIRWQEFRRFKTLPMTGGSDDQDAQTMEALTVMAEAAELAERERRA